MDRRVQDRLEHILTAISAIEGYMRGQCETDFAANRLLIDAVERNLERISEASRHIPEALKAKHPQLPWRAIAGIGNVLRHDYPDVNPREVWVTAVRDLAPLKAAIGSMLAKASSGDE